MPEWTLADMPDQTGRTVLVTGANSGLGLASAEALAARGARVLLGCRNPVKGESALRRVTVEATGPAPELVPLDLADQASIADAAAAVASLTDRLDVLMNNAGIMAVPEGRTPDGFELQFGTNHLGHFALTARLLPLLLAAEAPRVVTTSSGVHKAGRMHWDDLHLERRYGAWRAYCQSKLANLLFMFELDRRATAAGVPLVSAAGHPGYASTHLQLVGPDLTGNKGMGWLMNWGNAHLAQSAGAGALPQLRAATAPDVRGGEYYGPAGIGEFRGGGAVLVKPRPKAADPEAGRRLWERSVQYTGLAFDWG